MLNGAWADQELQTTANRHWRIAPVRPELGYWKSVSKSLHRRRNSLNTDIKLTGTIAAKQTGKNEQVLDKLKVERERGITADENADSMIYDSQASRYMLNLIDTPIDLPAADPDRVIAQMQATFGIDPEAVIPISAKTGRGVSELLRAIVERIPPLSASHRLHFEDFSSIRWDKISSTFTGKRYEIMELGIMHPEETSTSALYPGQVGYMACNMKEPTDAHVGDTLYRVGQPVDPIPGFKPAKPMVFAGVYPIDSGDFPKLEESIKRTWLPWYTAYGCLPPTTGRRIQCKRDYHCANCAVQRLDSRTLERDVAHIFEVVYKDKEVIVSNPTDFPEVTDTTSKVKEIQEPTVNASIIVPERGHLLPAHEQYFGDMMDLCFSHRAEDLDHRYLDSTEGSARILMTCTIPLSEIVTNFFDQLKSRSSGFGSFE
ncbi:Translation factor guf1 mitochondrial [Salix suchowensis]|nr:Translation factor guf1 mitochondrial [Salix suchowensis]